MPARHRNTHITFRGYQILTNASLYLMSRRAFYDGGSLGKQLLGRTRSLHSPATRPPRRNIGARSGLCSASVCVDVIIPEIVSEGGRMATAIGGSSKGSAYSLVVAYALILLSIWQVDLGLLRSASSPRIAAPAPFNVLEDSTP